MSAALAEVLEPAVVGDHSRYAAFTRRILRAYGRRVAAADPEDLAEMISLQRELNAAIDSAVAGLRSNGFSWAQIAEATGTTRQATHARWASKRA